MNKIIILLISSFLFSACGDKNTDNKTDKTSINNNSISHSKLDSLDKANNESVIASSDNINKAYVSLQDSLIDLRASMKQDHRIFGYAQPDIKSERLILMSVFTDDVKNNPFGCKLGAYYDTMGMDNLTLKYLATQNNFVKVAAIDNTNKTTIIYIEKKWIVFE